jgi:hypothetical protein
VAGVVSFCHAFPLASNLLSSMDFVSARVASLFRFSFCSSFLGGPV